MLQSPSFRRAWGGRGGQWTDKQADVSDSRVMGPVCGRGGDCHPGAQEGHLWRGGSPREGRHRNFTGLVPGCSGPLLCVCVCVSVSIAGGHRAVFPVGPWKLQRMQPYSSPGMSQGLAQGHAAHGGLAGRTGLRPPAQRFLPRRYSGAKGQMCLPGFRGTRGRASQCAITNRLEPHRWNPVMGRWAAGRIL